MSNVIVMEARESKIIWSVVALPNNETDTLLLFVRQNFIQTDKKSTPSTRLHTHVIGLTARHWQQTAQAPLTFNTCLTMMGSASRSLVAVMAFMLLTLFTTEVSSFRYEWCLR